ncbi:MAG: ergothioneine biosynthesis protein EgtB [Candidatus Binatia bacterium]
MRALVLSVCGDNLSARLDEVRCGTRSLLDLVDDDAFGAQPDPEFSPIGWHVGHIATFEEYWILEQCKGDPPRSAEYRRFFSPIETAKPHRCNLPPRPLVIEYFEEVHHDVLRYLKRVSFPSDHRSLRDGRILRNVLQHECQHSETIASVLQMRDRNRQTTMLLTPREVAATDMVHVAGGTFPMGRDPHGDWYDNEVPAHEVFVKDFLIDLHPVTNAQFAAFIAAGGYKTQRWWSAEGWAWRSAHGIVAPQYWCREAAGWWTAGFFGGTLAPNAPVLCVSWYEADAYARWVGKRLPTEAEWEKAAAWDAANKQALAYAWGDAPPDHTRCNFERCFDTTTPVGQFTTARSPSGCVDMNGNVWEWTASPFAPYPRFEPYPYAGYSQPYFDGRHMVLRGGSWASRDTIVRNTFRNWYIPSMRRVFAGLRCARGT